jgi:hemoglobin
MATLFEKIGAERLRAVLVDFYDRVFDDIMIGFLFAGKDKQRLIDKEWEFAAALLGAKVAYTGKPMTKAHAASPILGGHFERRQQLLRDTLADHKVSAEVVDAWIQHNDRLRQQITADKGSECDHDAAIVRLKTLED